MNCDGETEMKTIFNKTVCIEASSSCGGAQVNEQATEQSSIVEQNALEILNTGKPIDFLMEQFSKIHTGDEDLGELLLMTVGCQSGSNTEGLQPDLSGESGKGKSDACKAMGHLLPQEFFITGSNSTMALFHRDDIPTGAVIFLDDVKDFGDKEEQLIKTITSQYQSSYNHTYTDMKMSGAKKAQTVSIPPRVAFWITSVDSSFDPQILNRYLKMHVDVGSEQDFAVYKKQQEYAKNGSLRYAITPEVEISRVMIRKLKREKPKNVVIPFIDLIDWKGIENRRNYPMFLDIIRASAALNQYQRHSLTDGSIIGDLSDYDRAIRLWNGIERAQTTGLTDNEQCVLAAIKGSNATSGITLTDIAKVCSIQKGTAHRSIYGIKQRDGSYKGGIMNKLKGGLTFDDFERVFRCNGDVSSGVANIVTLANRQEAQELIDSCTRLHMVAT
jgi:hypothetical protein